MLSAPRRADSDLLVEELVARAWLDAFRFMERELQEEAGRCRGRDIDVRPRVWEPFERAVTHYVHRHLDARVGVNVRVMFRCDDYRDVVSMAVGVSFERRHFGFSWIYQSFTDMIMSGGYIRRMQETAPIRHHFESTSLYDDHPLQYRDRRPSTYDDRRAIVENSLAATHTLFKRFLQNEKPTDPGLAAVERLVEIVRSIGEALSLHLASALSLRGFIHWEVSTSKAQNWGRVRRTLFPAGVCALHGRVSPVYLTDQSTGESLRACLTCQERRIQPQQSVELLLSILTSVGEALALRLASSLSLRGYVEWSSGRALSPTAGRVRKAIRRDVGLWGVCPHHGLVASDTVGGERVCSKCNRCREAVRILVAVIRAVLDACTQKIRHAVDWLFSTMLLCAHILWEALSDWERRCLLLESGDAPDTVSDWERRRALFSSSRQIEGVVEPAVEEGLRFTLLELD